MTPTIFGAAGRIHAVRGIIDWRNTPPLALKDLHGKVIVLDFFGDYCSICHAYKPDLVKLRHTYGRQGYS